MHNGSSRADHDQPSARGGTAGRNRGRHRGLYRRHFSNPRRERAFLSASGFTLAFAIARGITHSIRAGIGPFHNITTGDTHVHHSTFGIFGLLSCGYLWTYQWAIGMNPDERWLSRVSAAGYGIASALTLDEFALWLDLQDDYWDRQGRKSIDAVALFGGLLAMGVAGRGALQELGLLPRWVERHVESRGGTPASSGLRLRWGSLSTGAGSA